MHISVLTVSFNAGEFLERAIQSVLQQDYKDWEHIIIDGGSTDNTVEILKKHPHLQWISEKDQGQSDAMNKAFVRSSGDLIVYLNADDEFLPDAFSTIVSTFNKFPEVDVVVGNLQFKSGTAVYHNNPSQNYTDILQFWLNRFPANPVAYFYKKHVQAYIGHFPTNNHYTMDYWFLLRVYKQFKVLKIERMLGVFHITPGCKTQQSDTQKLLYATVLEYLTTKESFSTRLWFYRKLLVEQIYRLRNRLFKKPKF